MVTKEIKPDISSIPNGYLEWREKIALLIEQSKLKAIMNVNTEMLTLYWNIGNDILTKQREEGWSINCQRICPNDSETTRGIRPAI